MRTAHDRRRNLALGLTLGLAAFWCAASPAPAQTADWAKQETGLGRIPARVGAMMAFDAAHGNSVMFGGIGVSSLGPINLDDTWIWDGKKWTQVFPAASPPPRYNGVIFYHAATGRVILFGGAAYISGVVIPLGDTWLWDGTNWQQLFPQSSPSARYGGAATYDSARDLAVVFGGFNSDYLAETWTWDGANWALASAQDPPAGRILPGLSYDSVLNQVVLFGGHSADGYLNDTWIWNGSTWTQRSPATSPAIRYGPSMVYDPSLGYSLLFGGNNKDGNLNDTWTWDGTNWSDVSPRHSPQPRFNAMMDYDSLNQVVVLFGGAHGTAHGDIYLDDTWFWTTGGLL